MIKKILDEILTNLEILGFTIRGYLLKLKTKFCRHKWVYSQTIPTYDIGDRVDIKPTKFNNIFYCDCCGIPKKVRVTSEVQE